MEIGCAREAKGIVVGEPTRLKRIKERLADYQYTETIKYERLDGSIIIDRHYKCRFRGRALTLYGLLSGMGAHPYWASADCKVVGCLILIPPMVNGENVEIKIDEGYCV